MRDGPGVGGGVRGSWIARGLAAAVALVLLTSGCYTSEIRPRKVLLSSDDGLAGGAEISPSATAASISGLTTGPSAGARGRVSAKSGAGDSSRQRGVSASTIKLGYVGDFAGQARAFYTPSFDSINAYISDLNSRGGIHGRKVELVYYSAGYQSDDQTLSAVRRLVEEDGIFGFIELEAMAWSTSAQAFLNEKGVPCIACRSPNQTNLELGPYNFMVQIDPQAHGDVIGGFMAKRLGKKYMALGYCESGFETRMAQLTGAAFERHGGRIVDKRSIGECQQTSMEASVAAWYSTVPRPDVLTIFDPVGMAEAAAAARRMGWDVQVTGRSGWFQLVLDIGGTQTDGLIATTEGIAPPGFQSAQMSHFRQVLKAYYPDRKVDKKTIEAWSAMVLFEEAALRVGPNLTARAFVDAIQGMRDFDDGMGARQSFSPQRHWSRTATGFYRIHNQSFERATVEDYFNPGDF